MVYLPTFTMKVNQNVSKFTIHGSYGKVKVKVRKVTQDILMLQKSAHFSS